MKKIFLLTLMMATSALFGFGQQSKFTLDKDSLIEYQAVVHLQDSTVKKDKLFTMAKLWFANNFVSSKNVLQIEDLNEGRLIGSCSEVLFPGYQLSLPTYLAYTLEFIVKDGRYKYKIYNVRLEGNQTENLSEVYGLYQKRKLPIVMFGEKPEIKRYGVKFDRVNEAIGKTIASFGKAMNNHDKSSDF
jgi:hypothetical protein